MTYLEYVLAKNPNMEAETLLRKFCPATFGLDDPARCDITCIECWNREYADKRPKIKVMLDPGAKMPTRAHELDAGYDLYSMEDAMICQNASGKFDTGVHIQIPPGYVGFLKSKSGLNVKSGIQSEGVIDAGYTGSICVKLYNHGAKAVEIKKGQKISQLVLLPIFTPDLELVDGLEETDRGNGGFGSTGAF